MHIKLTLCAAVIGLSSFFIISCDKEEEIPKIGFTSQTSLAVEGSSLSIPFNTPLPANVTPVIILDGSALEDVDYEWGISADGQEIVFEVLEDDVFDDETIEIEITGFSTSGANLGETLTHTITIEDPSLLIDLTWDEQDGGEADLDFYLLRETSPGSGEYNEVDFSTNITGSAEQVLLSGFDTNAKYAVGVEYFGGTSNDVDINITLSTTAGTVNNTLKELVFSGTLTEFHIDNDFSTLLFTKTNFNYGNFSALSIEVPPADLTISLSWNAGSGTAGDVDMDLFLYSLNPGTTNQYTLVDDATSASSPVETIVLPADAPNGTYAVGYEYYSGTSNNLQFTATFSTPSGSIQGSTTGSRSFAGTYTLANIDDGANENISQTFVKTGNSFTNFSSVVIPSTGSSPMFNGNPKKKQETEAKTRKRSSTKVKSNSLDRIVTLGN